MAKRPALIRKSDAMQLLKAARDAGFNNPRLEIEPGGKVVLVAENPVGPMPDAVPGEAANPWDEAVG